MPLWKIAWRSIQRRWLASLLTMISMALGVMLVVAVLLVVGLIEDSFRSNSSLGYDTIIGAKGGKLQLTLNTVFYLSQPVENLPYHYYQEFLSASDRKARNATVTVDYSPACAQEVGREWVPVDGTLEIPAGQAETRVRVPILKDDDLEEGPEEFSLNVHLQGEEAPIAVGVCTIAAEADTTTPTFTGSPFGGVPAIRIEPIEVQEADGFAEFVIVRQEIDSSLKLDFSFSDGRNGDFYPFLEPLVPAVPVCLGDYYDRYRVVGTTAGMFNLVFDTERNRGYEFADGHNFTGDGEYGVFEAILGARVARDKGLKVGDLIQPTHGAPEGEGTLHQDQFEIVGILKMSGTPQDRAVFVNMDGFNSISEHIRDDGMVEITSMLIDTKSALHSMQMEGVINEGVQAQLVKPVRQIFSLFSTIVGRIRNLLLVITALICVVSGISILVSIYNSMSDRKQEIAVMRSLGAGRSTVMTVVLLESVMISLIGGLMGWLAGHVLIGIASGKIERETGVMVSAFDLAPPIKELSYLLGPDLTPNISVEIWLIPGLILLAIVVGFMPALSAYRTDVAKALQSSP